MSTAAPVPPELDAFTAQWESLCADPKFNDLPYKVETDRYHRLLMSPARSEHSYWQTEITRLLAIQLPHGKAMVECAVATTDGIKVADASWFTLERFKIIRKQMACSVAPQIAVEVLSNSNTRREIEEKRALYFARGTEEFWLCDVEGRLTFFTPDGLVSRSHLCPEFPTELD